MGALILSEDITVYDAASIDLFPIEQFAKFMQWKRTKVESKIRNSWTEGKEFFRTPDGDVLISIQGYQQWAKQLYIQGQDCTATESKSVSHGTVSAIAQSSGGSKPRPTSKRPVSFTLK